MSRWDGAIGAAQPVGRYPRVGDQAFVDARAVDEARVRPVGINALDEETRTGVVANSSLVAMPFVHAVEPRGGVIVGAVLRVVGAEIVIAVRADLHHHVRYAIPVETGDELEVVPTRGDVDGIRRIDRREAVDPYAHDHLLLRGAAHLDLEIVIGAVRSEGYALHIETDLGDRAAHKAHGLQFGSREQHLCAVPRVEVAEYGGVTEPGARKGSRAYIDLGDDPRGAAGEVQAAVFRQGVIEFHQQFGRLALADVLISGKREFRCKSRDHGHRDARVQMDAIIRAGDVDDVGVSARHSIAAHGVGYVRGAQSSCGNPLIGVSTTGGIHGHIELHRRAEAEGRCHPG